MTLAVQVTTDGGSPVGVVELRDGSTVVGSRTLVSGAASLTLSDIAPGVHSYLATFLPTDTSSYAGSSSAVRSVEIAVVDTTATPVVTTPPPPDTPTPAPAPSSSTTTLKAPKRAKVGTRPVVAVTVKRASDAASGTVVITVGKKSKTLALKAGSAKLRLARVKKGRLKVTVRYLGNATTTASGATRTIKVGG